ncbi:MAG: ABC transporter permease subunit [Candidatus Eisenbacteria bacterium]
MNLRDLSLTGTVFLTELRSALRDRHVVVYSLLLPIFLYPALIWFFSQGYQYRMGALEKQISRVAWEGEGNLPLLFDRLRADARFEVAPGPAGEDGVGTGSLDAFLRATEDGRGGPRIEALFDLSRDRSRTTRDRLEEVWGALRRELREKGLGDYGATDATLAVFSIQEDNVASPEEMGRFLLALILPMILVIMLSMGAMYPAIDVLVGEKERGTLEGLLAAGAPRASLVAGKFLVVLTASFAALTANLTSMVFTIRHQASLFGGAEELSIGVPWSAIPVVLAGGLLLGAFFAASMILIASFARTFKEGQGYLTPFYLICLVPAIGGSVPSLEFTNATALIPLTNVTLLFRAALLGRIPASPALLTFLSLALYLAAALGLAQRVMGREEFFLGGGGRKKSLARIFGFARGGS